MRWNLAAVKRPGQMLIENRYLACAAANEEAEYAKGERAGQQENRVDRHGHEGSFSLGSPAPHKDS